MKVLSPQIEWDCARIDMNIASSSLAVLADCCLSVSAYCGLAILAGRSVEQPPHYLWGWTKLNSVFFSACRQCQALVSEAHRLIMDRWWNASSDKCDKNESSEHFIVDT